MEKEKVFVEIANHIEFKNKMVVGGDTFLSRKVAGDNRYVAVLSDGLGSGVKANVLSTMTASMALNYRLKREPMVRSALSVMNALPVDSVRNISYATFTIVDVDFEGQTEIVEFDTPPYLLFRENEYVNPTKEAIGIDRDGNEFRAYEGDPQMMAMTHNANKFRVMYRSNLKLCKGDRIIFYSDGITQSGMGLPEHPFGWGDENVVKYVKEVLHQEPDISARDLSQKMVREALRKDRLKAKDDISCAVVYCREPRRLLICTGPPYDDKKDKMLASYVDQYKGKKIVSGGTTSKIISRELNREIKVDISMPMSKDFPPAAQIEGIDLVCEGILTLGAAVEMLAKDAPLENAPKSPATDIVRMILESDIIDFMVGTRINEAHHDPSLPVELEIRRNVIKRMAYLQEEKWLKKVNISFI